MYFYAVAALADYMGIRNILELEYVGSVSDGSYPSFRLPFVPTIMPLQVCFQQTFGRLFLPAVVTSKSSFCVVLLQFVNCCLVVN